MDHIGKNRRKEHPRQRANIISKLTFFYTLGFFKKGYKNDLEEQDLYEVLTELRSGDVGNVLENKWKKLTKNGTPSLFKLLWNCYGPYYILLGIIQLVLSSLVALIKPNAQGKLVKYFEPGQDEVTKSDAWYYGSLLIGVDAIFCVYAHNYVLVLTTIGIKVRTALCSFIYRKVLKLNPQKLSEISIGKVVTLITKDVVVFEAFIYWANFIWTALIKAVILFSLMYWKVGPAALSVIPVFSIVMPVQIYLGTWTARLRLKMCEKLDDRLQKTQETLSSIRIIKMYTWEIFFWSKITHARNREISSLYSTIYLKFWIFTIGIVSAEMSLYVFMITYVWLGNTINGEKVYFIQSCLHMLIHSLSFLLPKGIVQCAQLHASGKRIGDVLKLMESPPKEQSNQETPVSKPKIILKNVSVKYRRAEILTHVTLDLQKGLHLITGPVGSGKTTLIKTLLHAYEKSEGRLEIVGKISYASQDPWLFPSSIRQNILFGQKYEEHRYKQIVEVCALKYDFDLLESGDDTIVEDSGMNLSKGQQTRINLARAIYKDVDIYLLDDCLSSLDGQVCDFIFKECIQKYLRDKLVLLVTHNKNYFQGADYVTIMSQGRVKSNSKPTEITEEDKTTPKIVEKRKPKELIKGIDELDENEETKLLTETTAQAKVYHEKKKSGKVSVSIYHKYIKYGGGYIVLTFVVVIFILSQISLSYSDVIVANWVNLELTITNLTENTEKYHKELELRTKTLYMYSFIMLCCIVFSSSKLFAIYIFGKRAALKLHKLMLHKVINASMEFFDKNFIGNILNRFSTDLSNIDEFLPEVCGQLLKATLWQIGVLWLIVLVNAEFLIPAVILITILVALRCFYIPTGRSLKRLDALTRSPVVGHLNATLEGLTTIKAFDAEDIVREEFDKHQDLYTSANYTMECCGKSFENLIGISATLFTGIITLRFLMVDDGQLSGDVGLVISQAVMLAESLQWTMKQWADLENQMTSVERAVEYTDVKGEPTHGTILEDWPRKGEIRYEDVSLTYTNSKEKVLKNINFSIGSQEKIGIVGRTGAGKSSIIATLFRLYEVEGKILIDGVDTKSLSLEFLRSKISIIPQDPVMFSGTIRDNIDPLKIHTDEEIWHAIETANLKALVPNLDLEICENGSNFSVGQRQLFCLARAVVCNNKIIVLDEATANMDYETDALIYETIQKNLRDCTVLIIAHKLQSIMNSDKIMVLDKGEIIQFDHPSILLVNKDGYFYKMAQKAGLLPTQ